MAEKITLAAVSFDTDKGLVTISPEMVRDSLALGNSPVTDNEIMMFLQLCKYQKLNPFLSEVYLVKYKNRQGEGEPTCSMLVDYSVYKKRADKNPDYRGRSSGIVVLRGTDQVLQKEGICLYPGERLLGGWCKVWRRRGDAIETIYREVSLAEYDKGTSIWKQKPATMINKVAVSQALRDAFVQDLEGLNTVEEAAPIGYESFAADASARPVDPDTGEIIHADGYVSNDEPNAPPEKVLAENLADGEVITQEDRKELFRLAKQVYGEKDREAKLRAILQKHRMDSTERMVRKQYKAILAEIQADGVALQAQKSQEPAKAAPAPKAAAQPPQQQKADEVDPFAEDDLSELDEPI